jgi:hypothetical protein
MTIEEMLGIKPATPQTPPPSPTPPSSEEPPVPEPETAPEAVPEVKPEAKPEVKPTNPDEMRSWKQSNALHFNLGWYAPATMTMGVASKILDALSSAKKSGASTLTLDDETMATLRGYGSEYINKWIDGGLTIRQKKKRGEATPKPSEPIGDEDTPTLFQELCEELARRPALIKSLHTLLIQK